MNEMSATKRPLNKGWIIGGGLAAVALALVVVLPSAANIDPTGLGEQLGLTEDPPIGVRELERGMLRMETEEVLVAGEAPAEPLPGMADVWEYELAPFESLELKYTIEQGEQIAFSWETDAPVHFDMHAHPFDGGTEVTESYAIDEGASQQASYNAPFTGYHGWYWDNRSVEPVTIRLEASGGMTHSTLFSKDGQTERPLPVAAVNDAAEQ